MMAEVLTKPVSAKGSRFGFETQGSLDIVDVTAKVQEAVRASGIREGIACVATAGSTAAVCTMEHEPGLVQDLRAALDRLLPREMRYAHADTGGDDNGDGHLRSPLLGTSLSLPVNGGRAALGTWQQVLFVELDHRPREREITVQVVGD